MTAIYNMSASTSVSAAFVSGRSKIGLIIPLYVYPNSVWQDLINWHTQYPTVPIRMIVNPHDGPSYYDSYLGSWITKEQSAGITPLGYVNTGYTAVSISEVETQIAEYANWYGIHGVFLDEMWNVPGQESYYSTITSYAHSIGVSIVVGNPGTSVSSGYINTVDNIGLYENSGLPSIGLIQAYNSGYPASTFSFITYNDGPLPSQDYFNTMSQYVSWISVTDYSQAYVFLPSYIGQELAELAAAT
jgi:hypothetical protein